MVQIQWIPAFMRFSEGELVLPPSEPLGAKLYLLLGWMTVDAVEEERTDNGESSSSGVYPGKLSEDDCGVFPFMFMRRKPRLRKLKMTHLTVSPPLSAPPAGLFCPPHNL